MSRLEARYGVQLFRRVGVGVAPTEAALALAAAYKAALNEIGRGEARAAKLAETPVFVVATLPSIASLWLGARLDGLQKALAGLQLELRTSRELADLETDGVDLGMRFGRGDWPGLHCELLFNERAVPVASPEFMAGRACLTPDEIAVSHLVLETPLLWPLWFEAAGLPPFQPPERAVAVVDDAGLAIAAARKGKGIALARRIHVVDAIAAGELVWASSIEITTPLSCYAVWRKDHPKLGLVHAAFEWLLDACDRSRLLTD